MTQLQSAPPRRDAKPRTDLLSRKFFNPSDRQLAWLLILPGLALIVLLLLAPVLLAVMDSFRDVRMGDTEGPFVGFANYLALYQDPAFLSALWRSLVWTVANVGLQTAVGLGMALVLHANIRGKIFVRTAALLPYVVPIVVVALVWRFILNPSQGIVSLPHAHGFGDAPTGLLNSEATAFLTTALISVWRFTPFMLILFLARLQTVPRELYDAAAVDGAGYWRTFSAVTLSWLKPVIVVAMLLRTLWIFADFDIIYLMTAGGPLQSTTTLPLLVRAAGFAENDAGKASAVGTVIALILLVVYIIYLKVFDKNKT